MDYITAKEAARLLGITERHLHREVTKGVLRQHFPQGRKTPYYDPDEVAVLSEMRARKLSLAEIAAIAQRTAIQQLRLEKLLQQVMKTVGADVPLLPVDRESIISLYLRAQDAQEQPHRHSVREVMEWAGIFSALGEEHLQAIETYFGVEEPWRIFQLLAMRMYTEYPNNLQGDPGAQTVYRLLNVARDKMRRTMWSYVAINHNRTLANKLFPKAQGDVHDDITALVVEKRRRRDISRRKH